MVSPRLMTRPLALLLIVAIATPSSAWAVPPTPASTLRPRAPERGTVVKSGLEESLMAPTIIGRVTDRGVQVARRAVGDVVGEGQWSLRDHALTIPPNADEQIQRRVQHFLQPGLAVLRVHAGDPAVHGVLDRASAQHVTLPVQFVADHSALLEWRPVDGSGRVWVDVTVSEELDKPEYAEGMGVLAAILLYQAAARAVGDSERQAYHAAIAFYESLSAAEQQALRAVLETDWVDHGNTFLTFLQDATNSAAAEVNLDDRLVHAVDTMTLEELVKTEGDPGRRDLLLRTIHHRDRVVSWLMGQVRVDLPYSRDALREVVREPDLDHRREEAYQLVSGYDRGVEQENARRVSAYVREESLPDDYPPATVVGGRLSRAFSNQALLFADSALVPKDEQVVRAISALDAVVRGQEFLEQIRAAMGKDPGLEQEWQSLIEKIERALTHLQPAMGRLRLLAFGPDRVSPMVQYHGASKQLREALEIFRAKAGDLVQAQQHSALTAARETTTRRAGPEATGKIVRPLGSLKETLAAFVGEHGQVEQAMTRLEEALVQTEALSAAFSIQLQRPSRTGAINFLDANDLIPKPEQEPALQKLVRLAGHNTYASPDYEWVAHVTDLIEAAPLFIYERVIEVDGKHVTVFEVDQEALEQTIRQMADYWARNIEQTMDSEHVALARELVVQENPALREQAANWQGQGLSAEAAYRRVIREADQPARDLVALVAAWLAAQFDQRIEEVEGYIERHWQRQQFVDRVEALRAVVVNNGQQCLKEAERRQAALRPEAERLQPLVTQRRRELPAFHLLTTEAPGLVEGFIQVVLEQEMALRNVIRGEGRRLKLDLTAEVEARKKAYEQRLTAIAEKVVEEFGYGVIVDNYVRQGMSRPRALQQVLDDNLTLRQEAVRLAVLGEVAKAEERGQDAADHPLVATLLHDRASTYETEARRLMDERHRYSPPPDAETFEHELGSTMRQLARADALAQLSAQHRDWHLEDRMASWYRAHTALAQMTARKEVIAAHDLNSKIEDPRYYYGSGATFQRNDGKFRPSGRRKRYHLIYAPSRVNLGKGERKSVEEWSQWVGVTDPLAARHAKRVYGLINYNVVVRTIKEAENFKVGENERTALTRAVVNTQAYYTQSLGDGDTEDLSYQINGRGGLRVATIKEGESFQAGPTAGYCIPKDPLFKLLRGALKDRQKLSQIGMPPHLHERFMTLVIELEAHRAEFETEGAFETWMTERLLSPESLRRRFDPPEADLVQRQLSQYISVAGGLLVFHVAKLHEILGMLGRPSLLATRGQDLGLLLWSNWASEKITLGGEQVNRSTVFQITRDIFELRAEAATRNPQVGIPEEAELRVHLYGPYKGDPDHPSPPDVRDSAAGRVFMDLSDLGEHIAHDLDEKGQAIWRANRYGLRLDSDDPKDLRVTRLLAEEYLDLTERQMMENDWYRGAWEVLRQRVTDPVVFERQRSALLDRAFAEVVRHRKAEGDPRVAVLEHEFPGHGTVGHIKVTVVPGVSAQDFMAFRSDAKTLMGEVADGVQQFLQTQGITPEQIRANAQLERPVGQWIPLTDLPPEQLATVQAKVGGEIHPLAFRLAGPGDDFSRDLQGRDIVVFMTVHPDLLALSPSQIRDRMLVGRPQSAAGVRDGSVQGRHRVWFDRDIMLWYAAWRGVDRDSQIITDWLTRDTQGRQAVYRAFGVGDQTWKPLLGTDLRDEAIRQEHRAMQLYDALARVAEASARDLPAAIAAARAVYAELLPQDRMMVEATLAGEYQQAMQTKGTDKPCDELIRQRLEALAEGLPLEQFTRTHWLAVGGMYLLHGAPKAQQDPVMQTLQRATARLQASAATSGLEEADAAVLRELLVPQETVEGIVAAERKGGEGTVKASEQVAVRAVARLTALKAEAARQAALAVREAGYREVQTQSGDSYVLAQQSFRALTHGLREGEAPEPLSRSMGQVIGWMARAMHQVNERLVTAPDERAAIDRQIVALTTGREFNPQATRAFSGSYEDPGIIAKWFELAGPARREEVAQVAELFTMALAIEKTTSFVGVTADAVNEPLLWRALAEFFSETIDDHFYEYNSWVYDPKRGAGFSEFYDDLGALKPGRANELYALAWRHHRLLYAYLRAVVVQKTALRELPEAERDLLLGHVRVGEAEDGDALSVQGIGAGAPTDIERKWRQYNQLRETAFLYNDGFATPVLFDQFDPMDPDVLNAGAKVNGAFLSPTNRTHYSRIPIEAPTLGENIFITRWGELVTPPGVTGSVLQIHDAQFWLSEAQYRQALLKFRHLAPQAADQQINQDRAQGRLTPKGIQVAAMFTRPVTIGWVVPIHHHPLEAALAKAGYPYTDKSGVHYAFTYNKSEYPRAYNPPATTGVYLPPEIDWLRTDTERLQSTGQSNGQIVAQIVEWLRPFAQAHRRLIIKGAAESGARNFLRCDVAPDGRIREAELRRAAEFIYEVSKGQHVTIQRAIITTPLAWMDAQAIHDFVGRQIRDWAVPVNLERHPKDWVYGTLRVILSAGMPNAGDLFNPANWNASHQIALMSLQVATNVGRQGTLEMLTDDLVRPEFRGWFLAELEQAGRQVMVATAQYAEHYWQDVYRPAYRARYGEDPPERDAAGVPYWWPRYLMIDILPEPIWGRQSQEVQGATIVDIIPGNPARGTQTRFVLRDAEGRQFDGEVLGFHFWLLEPNVGIGLWPNYWRREEAHERQRASAEGRPMDWTQVGVSARAVLSHYFEAGAALLHAKFGRAAAGWHPGPPRVPSSVTDIPSQASAAVVVPSVAFSNGEDRTRAEELARDATLSHLMAPPVRIVPGPVRDIGRWLPHPTTFALIAGNRELMSHNYFSMAATAAGQPVNVIGVATDWLTSDGKTRRFMVYDSASGEIVECACETPVDIHHAQFIEFPDAEEITLHRQWTVALQRAGVHIINPAGAAQRQADDKAFLRGASAVAVPKSPIVAQGALADAIQSQIVHELPDVPAVVVQPRMATTGGAGVAVFTDLAAAAQYAASLAATRPVLVSEHRGDVLFDGRPLAIRVNVSDGVVQSASAIMGPERSQIASLGREGQAVSVVEIAQSVEGLAEAWPAIEQVAVAKERAINEGVSPAEQLHLVGVDLVLEATPDGLRPIVLEVNARPGGLIFAERVHVESSDDGPRLVADAGAVTPGFWQAMISAAAGLEESLTDVAREIAEQGKDFGTLDIHYRGVGPDGHYTVENPAIMTLIWGGNVVDTQAVGAEVRQQLSGSAPTDVYTTPRYITVARCPSKQQSMERLLRNELKGRYVAIFLGDSEQGDLFTEAQAHNLPTASYAQVLFREAASEMPGGYPHLARAEPRGDGVDTVLTQLATAIEQGHTYRQVECLKTAISAWPSGIANSPIDPTTLAIFTDVDDSLMQAADTFEPAQDGVSGQVFQGQRLRALVSLGQARVAIRIHSGKALDELSGTRQQTDEVRLLRPLVAALREAGAAPTVVGYDGVLGLQQVRVTPAGAFTWERLEWPNGGARSFTTSEAVSVARTLAQIVLAHRQAVGLEERVATLTREAPDGTLRTVANAVTQVVHVPPATEYLGTEEGEWYEHTPGWRVLWGTLMMLRENLVDHVAQEVRADLKVSLAQDSGGPTRWQLVVASDDANPAGFAIPIYRAVAHRGASRKPADALGGEGLSAAYWMVTAIPGASLIVEADEPADPMNLERGGRKRSHYTFSQDPQAKRPTFTYAALGSATGQGTTITVRLPVQPLNLDEPMAQAAERIRQQLAGAPTKATGLEEDPPLSRWLEVINDSLSGMKLMREIYPESLTPEELAQKQRMWQGWFERLVKTGVFSQQIQTTVAWVPSRTALPTGGRHLDYKGFMGGAVGFPVLEGVGFLLQEVDGLKGAVEVYVVASPKEAVLEAYPEGRPRVFQLDASWMDPTTWRRNEQGDPLGPVNGLSQWDIGARFATEERVAATPNRLHLPDGKLKINYADDLIAGAVAFLQTPLGDSSGKARETFQQLIREKKGLRIAIASDVIPGGQSTSSAIVMAITQALNHRYGWGLDSLAMIKVGYSERVWAGTLGGVKDHAAMMFPPSFLGVEPIRIIKPIDMPSQLRLLSLDCGVSREEAPKYSDKMQQPYNGSEQIRARTGIGYALAVLWLSKRHPDLAPFLRIDPDDLINPYGYARELLPGRSGNLSPVQLLRLLRDIPAQGLTRDQLRQDLNADQDEVMGRFLDSLFSTESDLPPDQTRPAYRLREMFQFALTEEARNIITADVLEKMAQGQMNEEEVFARLVELTKAAHNGDRVTKYEINVRPVGDTLRLESVQEIGGDLLNSDGILDAQIARGENFTLEDLALGKAGSGSMERSIEPMDLLADLVEVFNQHHPSIPVEKRGKVTAAAVTGAGLGGIVSSLLIDPRYVKPIWDFLEYAYYGGEAFRLLGKSDITLTHEPPILLRPGKPAQVLTLPKAAGLEERTSQVLERQRLEPIPGLDGWRRLVYRQTDGGTLLGGIVRDDVPEAQIDPRASVEWGSMVEGPRTLLEAGSRLINGSMASDTALLAGATLDRSIAEGALVRERVRVTDAVLQPAFDEDSWGYTPATASNPELSVTNHTVEYQGRTYHVEVGRAATVASSVLQGSVVGDGSRIVESAIGVSRWGEQTQLRRVKSQLVTAAQGHVDVESPTATEISETAIVGVPPAEYPGTQFSLRNDRGYTEMVALNKIPLATYERGKLTVTWYEHPVPPLMLLGDLAIFSIFGGAPNPHSIKTDGQSTPGVITKITGAPGEQTSQHGRIIADPLSVVAPFTKVIGRLLGVPDVSDPTAVATEAEVTHLGALSVIGVDEHLGMLGAEAWGQLLPGEARGSLSRAAGVAPWTFMYAPEVIFTLMGQLAQGFPEGERGRYDDLPQRLLESGLAMSRWQLDQESAKPQRDKRVLDRLTQYIDGYERLLASNAWVSDGWIQDGNLRHPAHWHSVEGRWESDRFTPPNQQVSTEEFRQLPQGISRPAWDRWTHYYLSAEDLRVEPLLHADQLESAPETLSAWRIVKQDERYYYTVEGGRIGREVPLERIDPSAVIGPGTVLTGRETIVGVRSRLVRVVAEGLKTGTDVSLAFVRATKTALGDKVRFTWGKFDTVTVGEGTLGTFIGAAHGRIAANNTLHPFALLVDVITSPGNIIGGWVFNTTTQPGYMNMHLSTAAMNVAHQPLTFTAGGTTYNLGVASLNVAGGVLIGSEDGAPVQMSVAYPLSNATIQPGTRLGAFSVIKDEVGGTVLPLTYYAYANVPVEDPRYGTPGRHNDRIGGALDYPSIFLRNFIYRTKRGIWDDLKSQGKSEEQILQDPRLHAADLMVEAVIGETLGQAEKQLDEAQHSPSGISSAGHTVAQLEDGVRRLRENLDGRWRMHDHTFTEVQWVYQARDAQGRALDAWRPTALTAGLEDKVVFIGPEAATEAVFHGLAQLHPSTDERLALVMFAHDAAHKRQLEAGLEEAGLAPLEPVIDVQAQYGGDLHAAIVDRQLAYWSRHAEVHVLLSLVGLEGLGRFLHLPSAALRTWVEQVEHSAVGAAA